MMVPAMAWYPTELPSTVTLLSVAVSSFLKYCATAGSTLFRSLSLFFFSLLSAQAIVATTESVAISSHPRCIEIPLSPYHQPAWRRGGTITGGDCGRNARALRQNHNAVAAFRNRSLMPKSQRCLARRACQG